MCLIVFRNERGPVRKDDAKLLVSLAFLKVTANTDQLMIVLVIQVGHELARVEQLATRVFTMLVVFVFGAGFEETRVGILEHVIVGLFTAQSITIFLFRVLVKIVVRGKLSSYELTKVHRITRLTVWLVDSFGSDRLLCIQFKPF